MANRPNNWYEMDYSERQAWERNERALRDAEYERQEAADRAERAERQARDLQREARQRVAAAREEAEEYRDEVAEELDGLRAELVEVRNQLRLAKEEAALAAEWLKDNGHWPTFDEWASYRRCEEWNIEQQAEEAAGRAKQIDEAAGGD